MYNKAPNLRRAETRDEREGEDDAVRAVVAVALEVGLGALLHHANKRVLYQKCMQEAACGRRHCDRASRSQCLAQ